MQLTCIAGAEVHHTFKVQMFLFIMQLLWTKWLIEIPSEFVICYLNSCEHI